MCKFVKYYYDSYSRCVCVRFACYRWKAKSRRNCLIIYWTHVYWECMCTVYDKTKLVWHAFLISGNFVCVFGEENRRVHCSLAWWWRFAASTSCDFSFAQVKHISFRAIITFSGVIAIGRDRQTNNIFRISFVRQWMRASKSCASHVETAVMWCNSSPCRQKNIKH